MRTQKVAPACTGVAAVLLGAALWLLPQAVLAQAAGKSTPQSECMAAYRQQVAELTQATEAARGKHVLDPVRVSRLQAFGVQLGKLRDAAQRSARSLADCEQLTAQVEAEGQRLLRLTASDEAAVAPAAPAAGATAAPAARALPAATPAAAPPPPAPDNACITSVGQDFNEVAQLLTQLQRSRGEGQGPDAELMAASTRLNALRDSLLAGLKAPPDAAGCERLGKGVAEERDTLQRLQRSRTLVVVPAPAAAPAPVPMPMAQPAPAAVQAAPPPPPAPCIAANSQAYEDLVQRFSAFLQSGRVAGELMAPSQALGRRLAALNAALSPTQTVAAECTGNGRALAQAEAELQRLESRASSAPAAPQAELASDSTAAMMPPPTVVDTRARACVSELRLNFRDVQQVAMNLNSHGKLNANGRAQLKRLVQDLLLQQLVLFSRDILSLDECEQIARTFAGLRAQVQEVRSAYAQAFGTPVLAGDGGQAALQARPQGQNLQMAQPHSQMAPARPAFDAQAQECQQRLRGAQGEVMQQFQALQRSGRISPQESGEFQTMQSRVHDYAQSAARDGLSLGECQSIHNALGQMRNAVQRMGQHDPRIDACRNQLRQGQGELVNGFQSQQRTGRVSPQEFSEFQNINNRLNQMMQAAFREGASLQDCQQVGQFIGQAQGAVQRMGQVDPRLEQCKAQVRQGWNEVQQMFQAAARNGRMTPQKQQEVQRAQGRLGNLGNAAQRDFTSLQDCQMVGNALGQERGNLQNLARM